MHKMWHGVTIQIRRKFQTELNCLCTRTRILEKKHVYVYIPFDFVGYFVLCFQINISCKLCIHIMLKAKLVFLQIWQSHENFIIWTKTIGCPKLHRERIIVFLTNFLLMEMWDPNFKIMASNYCYTIHQRNRLH